MRRKYNIDLINYLKNKANKYTVDELLPKVNKKFNDTYTRVQLQKLLVRNKIEYKYKNRGVKLTYDGATELDGSYTCHSCFGEPNKEGYYERN